MKCAVSTCLSYSKKGSTIRFYSFPKDEALRVKWIEFCGRPSDFRFCEARICSLHFNADDFERNLQFEMGFCKRNGYKLKPNIVPTVREINDYNELITITDINKVMTSNDRVVEPHPDMNFEEITMSLYQYEITQNLEREIAQLKRENKLLQQAQRASSKEIKMVKERTKKLVIESCNLEKKLLKMFSASQVKKIKGGDRRIIWTDEDVEQSMKLHSISSKAYKYLLDKGFPLPSIRTLQNWLHKIQVNTDLEGTHEHNPDELEYIEQNVLVDGEIIVVQDELNMEQNEIWEDLIEEEPNTEINDLNVEIEVLEDELWTEI